LNTEPGVILGYQFLLRYDRSVCILIKTRPVASLGRERDRRVVWEGPKILNMSNTFFQGGLRHPEISCIHGRN